MNSRDLFHITPSGMTTPAPVTYIDTPTTPYIDACKVSVAPALPHQKRKLTRCSRIAWRKSHGSSTTFPCSGKQTPQPRLSCAMGHEYKYSRSTHPRSEWTNEIYALMQRVNKDYGTGFNSCLLNRYNTPKHYISSHSDDESQLSSGHVIGISLGGQWTAVMTKKDTVHHQSRRRGDTCARPVASRLCLGHGRGHPAAMDARPSRAVLFLRREGLYHLPGI